MRSAWDRVRHALLFEIVGLAIFIPLFAFALGQTPSDMGVVGVMSAMIATLWNFVYNLGFDKVMLYKLGSTVKTVRMRVAHAILFEAGLMVWLLPPIAWYLNMSLWDTFIMDLYIVAFYLIFAFCFNWAYDYIFPVGMELATERA
ncbi:PACE efflux transporter [Orrella sp. 11846]|uniref:PACE efflux transporter n=1 Tax=Orrella sp. 11846 TaxID=3409913 RepID=UPI003B5B4F2E